MRLETLQVQGYIPGIVVHEVQQLTDDSWQSAARFKSGNVQDDQYIREDQTVACELH